MYWIICGTSQQEFLSNTSITDNQGEDDPSQAVWNTYIDEAIEKLAKEGVNFSRPPEDTDKLYMSLGGSDVIEVTHPTGSSTEG